jgi:hypothetical protein
MICLLSGFRHFRIHVLQHTTTELIKLRGGLDNITALYSEDLAFDFLSRDRLLSPMASIYPSIYRRTCCDAVSGYHCGVIPHPV